MFPVSVEHVRWLGQRRRPRQQRRGASRIGQRFREWGPASKRATAEAQVCRRFNTDKGCPYGDACQFPHHVSRRRGTKWKAGGASDPRGTKRQGRRARRGSIGACAADGSALPAIASRPKKKGKAPAGAAAGDVGTAAGLEEDDQGRGPSVLRKVGPTSGPIGASSLSGQSELRPRAAAALVPGGGSGVLSRVLLLREMANTIGEDARVPDENMWGTLVTRVQTGLSSSMWTFRFCVCGSKDNLARRPPGCRPLYTVSLFLSAVARVLCVIG